MRPILTSPILTNATADWWWTSVKVSNMRHVDIWVFTTWFTWTLKIAVWLKDPNSKTPIDFTSASTPTNPWFYVYTVDTNTNIWTSGSTWYSYTTDTWTYSLAINKDLITSVNVYITRSAGSISVNMIWTTNE